MHPDDDSSGPGREADPPADDDLDGTGMRSLLSGLGAPEVSNDNLTDRLRRSMSDDGQSSTPRRLPPLDMPLSRPALSQRALLGVIGATAAAGVVGVLALSFIDLPETRPADALATTTLTGAGIPVTTSGVAYRAESLARQAARLVHSPPDSSRQENPEADAPRGFVASGPAPARDLGRASLSSDPRIESDVLSCLRHLRIPGRDIVAVDLAHFDDAPAAVVVTRQAERGHYLVRAIDPDCPVLGGAVLAGPELLPAQP